MLLPTLRLTPRRHLAGAVLLLFVLVLPEFAFNALRTGMFWRPGQAAPQFGSVHLTWSYALGTTGMFFGLSHGLLFFAPICLLAYFGAITYIARSPGSRRLPWLVGLGSTVAYTVVICAVHNWASFGWGPRYLVPLFSVLFLVGVLTVENRLVPRALGYALAAFGLLTQVPLALADWHAVVAVVGKNPRVPDPIVGLWRSMLDGIMHGSGIGSASDPRALQVPDVWWWHAVAHHAPHVLGLLVLLAASTSLIWVARSRSEAGHRRGHALPQRAGARQADLPAGGDVAGRVLARPAHLD